ncbi:hypothetical protein [Methanococcus maripaludis]|nr:hypothetical protein [Methanococcus maripaludis]
MKLFKIENEHDTKYIELEKVSKVLIGKLNNENKCNVKFYLSENSQSDICTLSEKELKTLTDILEKNVVNSVKSETNKLRVLPRSALGL